MIGLFVDRLQQKAGALTAVTVAEDLDALASGTAPEHGSAFVVPGPEKGLANKLSTGGFRQTVRTQVQVAFVVRHHGDVQGAQRAAAFDTFKNSIERALAGWAPLPESELCSLVVGEGASLGNGVSIYVQTWETTRFLKGE